MREYWDWNAVGISLLWRHCHTCTIIKKKVNGKYTILTDDCLYITVPLLWIAVCEFHSHIDSCTLWLFSGELLKICIFYGRPLLLNFFVVVFEEILKMCYFLVFTVLLSSDFHLYFRVSLMHHAGIFEVSLIFQEALFVSAKSQCLIRNTQFLLSTLKI